MLCVQGLQVEHSSINFRGVYWLLGCTMLIWKEERDDKCTFKFTLFTSDQPSWFLALVFAVVHT